MPNGGGEDFAGFGLSFGVKSFRFLRGDQISEKEGNGEGKKGIRVQGGEQVAKGNEFGCFPERYSSIEYEKRSIEQKIAN